MHLLALLLATLAAPVLLSHGGPAALASDYAKESATGGIAEAIAARCANGKGGGAMYRCLVVVDGDHTVTETITIGNGSSAVMALVLAGTGRGNHTDGGSSRCNASLQWDGPEGEPVIRLVGVRMSVLEGLCIRLDKGEDGVNVASHGILVEGDNAKGLVSYGLVLRDLAIDGLSRDWSMNAEHETTCLELAEGRGGADVQIDNFVVRNADMRCHRGMVLANGNSGGVSVYDARISYATVGVWVEDADLRLVGGYFDSASENAENTDDADELAACERSDAAVLIGTPRADPNQQPKNISLQTRFEADCGRIVATLGSVRRDVTSIRDSQLFTGALDGAPILDFGQSGALVVTGTRMGVRAGAKSARVVIEPPDEGPKLSLHWAGNLLAPSVTVTRDDARIQ